MARGLIVVLAVAGCGPATPAAVVPADPAPAATGYRRGPIGRVLVPAQLGDPGALERIPYGVHILRFGKVWLVLGGEPNERSSERTFPVEETWPAIAESGDRVQVVSTEDDAHLAVWVDRADLASAAIDAVAVTARPGGPADDAASVVLRGGAPVTVTGRVRAGGTNAVEIRMIDRLLQVVGWVPADAIGEVFAIDRAEPQPGHRVAAGVVRGGAVIRAAASATARGLATVRGDFVPAQIQPVAMVGWREVRIVTPHARIHGWVTAEQVRPETAGTFGTTGHGSGFGASHRQALEVPAGTCFYAAVEGEVVGVAVETVTRLVAAVEEPGWWRVTVSSPWGLHELYVRDAAGGADVALARLESCTDPDAP